MTPDFLAGYCGMDGLCGWPMVGHTVFRFALHFVVAYWLATQVHHAWEVGVDCGEGRIRRGWRRLLPWRLHGVSAYAVPVMLVALVSFIREPWDVAHGDPALKSMTDFVSWNAGAVVYSVQTYILTPRWKRIRREIKGGLG